ncbi:hypothetical protein CMI47_08950 [Candidatus Pacearchaeota archaeon]|nr:hypothetical protein [Candidatus Pacearchaeota archaeon]|tara:strand:- start:357 stop:986 length:630 start_codon:yes stop_codon:yes gene_type:complete
MSLKLLNPGLRPLGQFDLDDADNGALEGGEYVELAAMTGPGSEGYAADVASGPTPVAGVPQGVSFIRKVRVAGSLGGLSDDGGEVSGGYGTLFGSLIGQTAGQATNVAGAVVIGPATNRGSGKVTVWAQAGLYGVNDTADTLSAATSTVNAAVEATAAGLLTTVGGGIQLGIYVGQVTDSSLVSTTNTAVGLAAATEYHAVWFLGNALL